MKDKVEQETELQQRMIMSAKHIIELLGFSVKKFFLLQDQFCEQIEVAAMSPHVIPI